MSLNTFFAPLRAHDVVVVSFAALLSILNVVFSQAIGEWYWLILLNILVSLGIIVLAFYDERTSSKTLSFIHFWYLAPLILLMYKELYFMIPPIHGKDYDDIFIAIDRWLFGIDPTVWLTQFASPLVTEILQIGYSSFYFLLIVVGYEFYRTGDRSQFFSYAFLVVYGFYLSYLGYFLLPAVGPRFTLHDFDTLNDELPGLLLTNLLRDFVNMAESIPPGVSNPIAYAQRDVFPSGHSMMVLVLMHIVVKYRMKVKVLVLVMGTLLIIGTVYLRYHYVIDVIAGIVFYGLCMWTAPWVYQAWERHRKKLSG